ncbi:MAG TPA: sensor histidine kinase [Pyrinomonadaceae bacterium]|nr:sensor histidine kinase [Pyrinomonadaceae bacterium]
MRSGNNTATLSEGVPVSDFVSPRLTETGELIEQVKTTTRTRRLDLTSKPLWFRLLVSLAFVLISLLINGILSLAVDRPLTTPLFLVAIVGSAWLCGFGAGVFATIVSGFLIDYFFVPPLLEFDLSRDEIVRFAIFLAEGGIVSWVIETRRIANDAMDRTNEQLRALAERQQTVRELEQKRIALEIHDELGQALTGLKMEVHLLKRQTESNGENLSADRMSEKLCQLSSTIDATIGTVRRIATELRPSVLDDFGLIAAMEWQAQESERKTEIPAIYRTDTDHLNLNPQAQIAVFRIFQEALTNIARHSQASHFTVDIDSKSDPIVITIKDDGIGFDPKSLSNVHSLGIVGMKERSNLIGAEFSMYNRRSGGVGIELKIPRSLQLSHKQKEANSIEK